MDKEEVEWFFLSFRNPDTNINLGCCNISIDKKETSIDAVVKAHQLGINPGGEVLIFPVESPELEPNRLYTRQEMVDQDYKKLDGTKMK